MRDKPSITSQKALRESFWEAHPTLDRRIVNGDYLTDTRVSFVDYVDALSRDGVISEKLAQKATLK